MSKNWGRIGLLGNLIAIIGLFWQPLLLGGLAIALGLLGVSSMHKTASAHSIILGAIVLVVGIV